MSRRLLLSTALVAAALALAACGQKDAAPESTAAPAAGATTAATTEAASAATAPADGTWTPEALEELLAPIAIYPDVVLGHVLTASTNPQEVLDAGNWLIANQDLSGSALDDAATKLGFSPSTRALLQFPETVDMMCMKMDWTTQLGQAFTADQGAVLDAVQRLRKQAQDVGNLESSAQLAVETETQDDKEIVTVKPADPEIVYVPKYDPTAVYAPPPATIPPPTTMPVAATAPATTTTPVTTTTTESKGHSTGALITTGLLAFGAGILVNEIFDDDDDWDDYYPNYHHGGMYYGSRPYYPPPPYMYRPPYGPGFYPSNGYTRPPNYQHGFNNNTIIVNNGGNDYWNRYDKGSNNLQNRQAKSPISAAKPNRPELNSLNQQARERAKPRTQQVANRDAQLDKTREAGKPVQGGYAGARPENKAARDRMVQNSPPPGVNKDLPKRPQGTYAGAKDRPAAAKKPADLQRPASTQRPSAAKPATREMPKQRPADTADRGRPTTTRPGTPEARPAMPTSRPSKPEARPAARPSAQPKQQDRTAFNTGNAKPARAEHGASQRGRQSMPAGAKGGQKPRR